MTGDTSRVLCPKCRGKLLWNGKLFVCMNCSYQAPYKDDRKPRKPSK